jgi:hypothetical protein
MHSTSFPSGLPWKGTLTPKPPPAKSMGGLTARLGVDYIWQAGSVIEKWVNPNNYNCYEYRFSLMLYPSKNLKLRECSLTLRLMPEMGVQPAFMWAGARQARPGRPGPITLSIAPELDTMIGKIKIGSVGITLPKGEAHPLARVSWHEDTEAVWHFSQNIKHPLEGSHELLAVLAVPEDLIRVECAAFLDVAVKGNTKNRWQLPADYPDGVRFSIDLQ